jgi:hypothetical protein
VAPKSVFDLAAYYLTASYVILNHPPVSALDANGVLGAPPGPPAKNIYFAKFARESGETFERAHGRLGQRAVGAMPVSNQRFFLFLLVMWTVGILLLWIAIRLIDAYAFD